MIDYFISMSEYQKMKEFTEEFFMQTEGGKVFSQVFYRIFHSTFSIIDDSEGEMNPYAE